MLTLSKPISAGQAVTYHAQEFTNAKENYYAKGTQIEGQWHGRLATAFGLEGTVVPQQFQRLADGQDPWTGAQLIRRVAAHTYVNARGDTVKTMAHRAGWDATFSAPKSVSLVALVGGDDRVRVAHRESVRVALDALERYTQARLGGVRLPETTKQWVAATFEHDSARPVEGYAAPQLHTHAVIFNLTRTVQGRMRSVQPRELYKSQAYATAAYRAELAQRLLALGYPIDRGKSGQPEIQGFTPEYLEAASPRRKQIQAHLAEYGRAGAGAAQIAAHQTRDTKVERTRESVLQQHQEMARSHGNQPQRAAALALSRSRTRVSRAPDDNRTRHAVQYAKDRNMERSAVVDERAILTDAMKRGMGEVTTAAVHLEFDRRVTGGELVSRKPTRGSAARAFTTPETIALERATLERLWHSQGHCAPLATADTRAAIDQQYPHLHRDQRAAVQKILASSDQITAMDGIAGSGKNTALTAVREAAERAGFYVHGLAPTSRAAAHLADAGMSTQTLQRFIALPASTDPRPRLTVLDESSLASTVLMKDFLDRMRPTDRVLLVGDTRQHQSVDAGKSYEQLQEAGLETARLTHIVRQPDAGLKSVVAHLADRNVRAALATLTHLGKVHEIPDRTARLDALAQHFVTPAERLQHTLVVAPDNRSRTEINEVIHRALQAVRSVDADHVATRVLVGRHDMTGTDRAYADRYDVGDIVRYTKGSATVGLAAGEYAMVTDRVRLTNQLTVQRADGTAVTYDPRRLRGVSVYRDQERLFAPGDRVQFTAPNREFQVANRQLGTLQALEDGRVTIALDSGRTLTFRVASHPHLDYGYAVTSHSSQGLTADRVLVHIDSERGGEEVVNQRLAYVALSRARFDAQLYTDNKALLSHSLSRDVSHRAAIEQPRALQTPKHVHRGRELARQHWNRHE